MDFFFRKGLKIRQSGNCRALGCPKSGGSLHSFRGTNSVEAGAPTEGEMDDAKGGDTGDTKFFGGALDGRGSSIAWP